MMEYKDFAIDLAKQAGEIMRKNFKLGMEKLWKEDNTALTATDIAINKLVIQEVQKYFPEHDIKGEEESSRINGSNYLWVCDPVDGTTVFSHGIPISSFSLALVKDGKSILGTVYDPFMDRLYFAQKDNGATLNNQPIHVSPSTTLKREMVDIEGFDKKYDTTKLPTLLNKLGAKVASFHSTVFSGCMVANGEFIATIFPHHSCHDIAALKIIVEEAGGKVTDIFGNDQRYDQDIKGAVITNGKVHDLIIKEISVAINQ